MRLTKLAIALAFGLAALGVQTARADGPDDRALYEMLAKSYMIRANGMVRKADFLKLMEKRFDAMDKERRGELAVHDLSKLLDPKYDK